MRVLNLSGGTFDYHSKFRVDGVNGDVRLMRDKEVEGDGIYWGLQGGTLIKSHYTQEEIDHKERMKNEVPIKDGEEVLIDGEVYIARIIGNYSDCIVFDKA